MHFQFNFFTNIPENLMIITKHDKLNLHLVKIDCAIIIMNYVIKRIEETINVVSFKKLKIVRWELPHFQM